jgi:hypothetical protein
MCLLRLFLYIRPMNHGGRDNGWASLRSGLQAVWEIYCILLYDFHWLKSFWSHYVPWVDSASKWVPGVLPGGKCGRCVRLTTLPPSCAVVMKYGNLNFLEPSGPPQACNGTPLTFLLCYMNVWLHVSTGYVVTFWIFGNMTIKTKISDFI